MLSYHHSIHYTHRMQLPQDKKAKTFRFSLLYPLRGSKVACNLTEGVSQSPLVAVREYDRGNPP